jgi:hypothetical protein
VMTVLAVGRKILLSYGRYVGISICVMYLDLAVRILLLWVRHDRGIGYRSGVRYCFLGRLDILLWVGDRIYGKRLCELCLCSKRSIVVFDSTFRTLKESEVTSEQGILVA